MVFAESFRSDLTIRRLWSDALAARRKAGSAGAAEEKQPDTDSFVTDSDTEAEDDEFDDDGAEDGADADSTGK